MDRSAPVRIQVQAAEALADWKALFAEQVTAKAKELAKDSNPTGLVTLNHYRRAAQFALESLTVAVQNTGMSDDRQEAA